MFAGSQRNVSQGDKIIPIEIIDINSIASKGDFSKKAQKQIIKENNKKQFKEKISKKRIEDKIINKNKNKTNSELYKQQKEEETSIQKKESKIQKKIGSEGNKNSNEVEKGSIKGQGKLKITCLKCVRPKYPPKALRRGAEGKPIVKIWINKDGKVTKTELHKKSGNESIDNAAINAANSSSFYPLSESTTYKIEYDLKIR